MIKKKITASDYLYLGLYAFAGFGLEILLAILFANILGVQSFEYTTAQKCIYWTLTCILWGAAGVFLIQFSKKKCDFDVMKYKDKPSGKQWVLAIAISVFAIIISTIVGDGFKPLREYSANGAIKFIFQHIYYFFETVLIVLTIAFGQKFGEAATKKTMLPYGGLFLALTWGLIHILTQGFTTGVYAFVMSIIYGIVYLILKKNFGYSFLLIVFMFTL